MNLRVVEDYPFLWLRRGAKMQEADEIAPLCLETLDIGIEQKIGQAVNTSFSRSLANVMGGEMD